jgi:hypothetical protein
MTTTKRRLNAVDFEAVITALAVYDFNVSPKDIIDDAYTHGNAPYRADKVEKFMNGGRGRRGILGTWGKLDDGNRARFARKIVERYGEYADRVVESHREDDE